MSTVEPGRTGQPGLKSRPTGERATGERATGERGTGERATGDRAAQDNPDVDYEHSDINVRGVFYFVAVLLVSGAVILAAMAWLFNVLAAREARRDPPPRALTSGPHPRTPPEPRLLTDEIQGLKTFRGTEDALLNGYTWLDKPGGVVRIPIARAKQLLVERSAATAAVAGAVTGAAPAAMAAEPARPLDSAAGRVVPAHTP